jgi:hypothetical protein
MSKPFEETASLTTAIMQNVITRAGKFRRSSFQSPVELKSAMSSSLIVLEEINRELWHLFYAQTEEYPPLTPPSVSAASGRVDD